MIGDSDNHSPTFASHQGNNIGRDHTLLTLNKLPYPSDHLLYVTDYRLHDQVEIAGTW